jgi:tetratricopeptide (TPR) repeat protein
VPCGMVSCGVVVLFSLTATAWGEGDAAPPAAARTVAEARGLLEAGALVEARDALLRLAEGGDDPEVHRLLGEAYFRLQRWPEARRHVRAAIATDEIAADRVRLGEIDLRARRFAGALAQFRQAGRLGVADGELHYRLARAYLAMGRVHGDITKVEAPDGQLGRRAGELVLIEPIAGDPDWYWAGSRDSAAFHLERARVLDFDSAKLGVLEARFLLAARRYRQAQQRFEQLEEGLVLAGLNDTDRTEAYAEFAEACFRADDLPAYLRRIRLAHAEAIDPAEVSAAMGAAYRRVAERYADRGALRLCIEFLEKAVAEAPRDVPLRLTLGDRYYDAGAAAKAAREYRIVLQLDPDHPRRGRLLDRLHTIELEYAESGE